jgi:3-oxo-4,17-pregnadiene-20-carboxyl-CoA hydratase beta subunit
MSRDPFETRSFSSVAVGDELPPLDIPLTRTLIISTAIASRDYQDVHHDPALAEMRGSPDIFMNILTTNGFVGRFVTDWTGPEARLRKVDIRLGAPNFPGDTMTLEGAVTAKDEAASTVEVSLRGHNGIGDHVTGTVLVVLPD